MQVIFMDPRPSNPNVSLRETKDFLPRMTHYLRHTPCHPWQGKLALAKQARSFPWPRIYKYQEKSAAHG
jgi:hypothetical protein